MKILNITFGLTFGLFLLNPLFAEECLDCHEDLIEGKMIHVPVEEGDCESCHTQKKKDHPSRKGNEFELSNKNTDELCASCHDISVGKNTHSPVADGMCLSCHDAHKSSLPNMLVGKTAGDACKDCHSEGSEGKKWVHGPAAVGACGVCHSSHGNTGNALLTNNSKTDVCYVCHSAKKAEFESYTYVHGPVNNSCSDCHNPHESDHKFTLNDGGAKLCLKCHTDVQHSIENATSKHKAIFEDKACLNCHTAHGANIKYNLKQNTFDLCLSCHEKSIKTENATIPGMKSFLKRNKNWHGPIKDKNCSGCHVPHGSEHIRLLKNVFPKEFYAKFDVKKYQLCFDCHPQTNVMDKNTSKLTNFRNQDQNLHYLHVNREKGRTCRACHQIHASNQPYHIRESVPFGATGWELPINFEANETGGSCLPGCHKHFTYKR